MNNRMSPSRGPRPTPRSKTEPGPNPGNPSSKYHWRRGWCPWYDYDWYDYDWYDYDWYDYDDYLSAYGAEGQPTRTSKEAPKSKNVSEFMIMVQEAYRQGFMDGWAAAGKDCGTVTEPTMPEPIPMPSPEESK